MAALLGNSTTTIAMAQADGDKTRQWLESTAGQAYVTQATSFQGAADGHYREARHADIRQVSRIDWRDLTELIEGEFIMLFRGRRIYGQVFHAKINDGGLKRLGHTLMLAPPDPVELRARRDRAAEIACKIEKGSVIDVARPDPSPGIETLVRTYMASAAAGDDGETCAMKAVRAVGKLPDDKLPPRPPAPADGTPVIDVSFMLSASSQAIFAGSAKAGMPHEPVDGMLFRAFTDIERFSGLGEAAARGAARAILAERDEAFEAIDPIDPPVMSPEELTRHLKSVIKTISQLRTATRKKEAA